MKLQSSSPPGPSGGKPKSMTTDTCFQNPQGGRIYSLAAPLLLLQQNVIVFSYPCIKAFYVHHIRYRGAYKLIQARVSMFKCLEDFSPLSSDWVNPLGTGPSFCVQIRLGHLLHVAWGNY